MMRSVVPAAFRPGDRGCSGGGSSNGSQPGHGGGHSHPQAGPQAAPQAGHKLPQMHVANGSSGRQIGSSNGVGPREGPDLSIYDSLGEFFSSEDLGGENCYRCEKCKKLQRARRHLRILSLPPLLSLHLKRFSFLLGQGAKKASDRLAFPLSGLSLDLFAATGTSREVGTAEYDLVSVVAHHGASLTSGHYTAYVKASDERWYHVDDIRVTLVSPEQVQNCDAYVLFYERRQLSESVAHRLQTIDAIRQYNRGGASDSLATPGSSSCGVRGLSVQRPPPVLTTVRQTGMSKSTAASAMTEQCSSSSGNGIGNGGEEAMLLSLGWFARYCSTDSPGPVTHADALCPHDAVDVYGSAGRSLSGTRLCFLQVPRSVWTELTTRFQQVADVASPITRLGECQHCQVRHQQEREALQAEREEISKLDSTKLEAGQTWFLVEAGWLKHWREYCWENARSDPPGAVCNWRLLAGTQPRPNLVRARDYRGVNHAVWRVFIHRYGGYPPICRFDLDIYAAPAPVPPDC